jgi:hypothetical protein
VSVDTGQASRQLRLIGEISGIAQELGIQVWLRGGWAMDFFLGEVSRDHVDIDWFVWADAAAGLTATLPDHGYQSQPGPPADQQLDFVKDGVEHSFALLARNEAGHVVVAGGPWAGEPWPSDMLDAHVGQIGQLRCAIISPRAQIEIKQMMPVWVPGRPRRAKDSEDIGRLEAALGKQGPVPPPGHGASH